MNSKDIREKFLSFFEAKGHTRVDSSSLQLNDDPTLLFPNAGMCQFKECFLGHNDRGYVRATSSQKCMRISGKHNDFENVGMTPRHHTFFEMLGNFSFGDYFKKEAIEYAWEFVIDVLQIPQERLWITIFEDDDEAEELWKKHSDVPAEKIVRLGESENFWSMGDTGPCGPCSEIHYYTGDDPSKATRKGLEEDDGTFLEIWNLVFMQFNRDESGKLHPLPKPSVDTGMGFERVASVCQGVGSTYDTDLLRGVISICEKLSGYTYDGSSFEVRDLKTDKEYARDVAMRVIADHSRSIAFLIADGIHPASDGRGYVLRRILRRAVRHGRSLNFPEPFLAQTTGYVVDLMGDIYPELRERRDIITKVADAEERKFYETLDAGLAVLQKEVARLNKDELFPGKTAFLLHDTFGFPLDLTEDALKPDNIKVDTTAFHKEMDAQKKRSREDRKEQGISFDSVSLSGKPTTFLGYQELKAESKLTQLLGGEKPSYGEGETVTLVFEETPFYGESGGQVGDTGEIIFADAKLSLVDTQKSPSGHFLHHVKVVQGSLSPSLIGEKATLCVDQARRAAIIRNHSATHLVHSGLRTVLGEHVQQAGSRVDDRSLRFDYSHFEQVTPEQLKEIQEFVNDQIRANHEVVTQEMPIEQAREKGATALFGEKYGDVVRVVEIGPQSLELCGGTHANRSGDIGFLMISSEGGISSGVRRIECLTGIGAEQQISYEHDERYEIAHLLKSDAKELPSKVEKILHRQKELEREIEKLKSQLASNASGDLFDKARTSPEGVRVIAEHVGDTDPKSLRNMVDNLRVKLGSGVVVLGSQQGDKGLIIAGVTSDLTEKIHAGTLVREAAKATGGKGGGRPDFAQAGGLDPALLPKALDLVFGLVG